MIRKAKLAPLEKWGGPHAWLNDFEDMGFKVILYQDDGFQVIRVKDGTGWESPWVRAPGETRARAELWFFVLGHLKG